MPSFGAKKIQYIMYVFFKKYHESNTSEFRLFYKVVVLKKTVCFCGFHTSIYLLDVYFVTALVPSLTACLASSPGKRSRTAV